MSFYVGQKVVLINADGWFIPCDRPSPQIGGVYVISELLEFDGIAAMSLVGFHPDDFYGCFRFRPLDEMKREAADRAMREVVV